MKLDGDLADMLEELGHAGIRPIVHQKTGYERRWVAYPESEVRWFHIGEGPDPTSAVRSLYVHTLAHPPTGQPAGEARTPEPPRIHETPEYFLAQRAREWGRA